MKRLFGKIIIVTLTATLLSGCTLSSIGGTNKKEIEKNIDEEETNVIENEDSSGNKGEDNTNGKIEEDKDNLGNNIDNEGDTKEEEGNANIDPKDEIDLSLKPNEVGQVMVLMYHGIDEKEATWVRTPENFRKDLETLYAKGYRAISLKEFVENDINVEAGKTPVVITFDDGLQNNFNIIEENGEKIIDPNCAIGIMEDFKKNYPDFNTTATFFLNGANPFRQPDLIEYKLNWLVDNGYNVGNHTLGHNDMKSVSDPDKIQKYIGKQATFLEGFLTDYKINTYALANGGRPNKELYDYLEQGEYEENKYKNIAILNVGWDPSISPIDKKFNPLSIHRVRASETNVDNVGMYDWLKMFDKYPNRKYISDGKQGIVTVPKKYESKVDIEKLEEKELYLYETNND